MIVRKGRGLLKFTDDTHCDFLKTSSFASWELWQLGRESSPSQGTRQTVTCGRLTHQGRTGRVKMSDVFSLRSEKEGQEGRGIP